MVAPAPSAAPNAEVADLSRRLQDGARQLQAQFLGKEEIIRLLFISAVAGEHLVMVGPPGTAKSALLRSFAEVIEAKVLQGLARPLPFGHGWCLAPNRCGGSQRSRHLLVTWHPLCALSRPQQTCARRLH